MIDVAAFLAAARDALRADPLLAADLRAVLGASAADVETPIPLAATGQPVRVLRRAIRAGEIAAVKVGREYRVTRAALTAWLATRIVGPRPPTPKPETPAARAIARARQAGALRAVG